MNPVRAIQLSRARRAKVVQKGQNVTREALDINRLYQQPEPDQQIVDAEAIRALHAA
jgi:hypothetical protein